MYSELPDKELLKILDQHDLLTFESQLSLRKEIRERNINMDISHLEDSIQTTLSEIKNFKYLKDFGFIAERSQQWLSITRSKKATFTDVVAITVGLIVFFIGIYGVINLVMSFVNGEEQDVFTLAYRAAIASCVFIGISFFSGLKRLFDYNGFQLSNNEGMITLRKRFDIKIEEIKAQASELFLEKNEDSFNLKLGEEIIFTSNADNLIQTMTLKELAKALKGE